jgi:hypothetical protein
MRKAIVIGMLGLALGANRAAAQTAVEQAQILREFQRSVVDYSQRDTCLMFPEATTAASPAPRIFTLPVAMVFRQMIAGSLVAPDGAPSDVLKQLEDVLPLLPAPLEYRLVDHDLAIRDAQAGVNIAVLRDAIGAIPTRR